MGAAPSRTPVPADRRTPAAYAQAVRAHLRRGLVRRECTCWAGRGARGDGLRRSMDARRRLHGLWQTNLRHAHDIAGLFRPHWTIQIDDHAGLCLLLLNDIDALLKGPTAAKYCGYALFHLTGEVLVRRLTCDEAERTAHLTKLRRLAEQLIVLY